MQTTSTPDAAATTAADVAELVKRLLKRAAVDRQCAANSAVIVDLLKPQMDAFDLRNGEHPWNTYAVRMAVDHANSVKRDNRYADDLEAAVRAILKEQTHD